MKSYYRQPTGNDLGECLNMMPDKNGTITTIEPTKNAVIVQLYEKVIDNGERQITRLICIECMDEKLYPDLKEEALRIVRAE